MNSFVTAIGTANPQYCISQMQFADFYADALSFNELERRKLKAFYRYTKIHSRYTVLEDYTKRQGDFSFYPNNSDFLPIPTISKRMKVFKENAINVSMKAIKNCIDSLESFDPLSINHIIVSSCTGMYAPGVEIEIIEHLGLSTQIGKTAINFMGCFAALNALKIADALCNANGNFKVLIVNVELPSIHFQNSVQEEFLISNSLFGDGATAMLVDSDPPTGLSLKVKDFFSDISLNGKNDLIWQIGDFGFEVLLSEYVPIIVKGDIKKVLDNMLLKTNMNQSDIDFYAFHPGGRAILEAIESQVGISKEDNRFAYDILKNFGNMSSCTFVFVLAKIFAELSLKDKNKNILGCSFGPGLTMESVILECKYFE